MAYSTGSVTLTNGSKTITGTGTAWNSVGRIAPGSMLEVPGSVVGIASISSDTAGELEFEWQGSTSTFSDYRMFTVSEVKAAQSAALTTLINELSAGADAVLAGKFEDGTLAQPGMRFATDEDNGLRRIGANNWAAVVGGADRMRFTTTGAVLDGLMTGTAVTQSDVDTTSGRLLKTGAQEWADITNINVANIGGTALSGFQGDDAGPFVLTGEEPDKFGMIIATKRTTDRAHQIAQTLSEQIFHRVERDGGFDPWKRVFDTGNLLGSVSESSGVPTGAVIEHDLNANGKYTMFADGTMICWHSLNSSNSAEVTWTFPAAFVDTAHAVIATPLSSSTAATSSVSSILASSCDFSTFNSAGGRAVWTNKLLAIGRWF